MTIHTLTVRLLAAVCAVAIGCANATSHSDASQSETPIDAGTPDADDRACQRHIDCNDDNPCTDDVCTAEGACVRTANVAPCDDGDSCTEADICRDKLCTGGANTCACLTTADCAAFEDGDLCNGTLLCTDEHVCILDPDTVVTCPTGLDTECRKNRCVPNTGICELADEPDNTSCDDGDNCTGDDSCQSATCVGATESCCEDQINNDGDSATDCDDSDCAADPVCAPGCPALEPVDDSPLPVESATNQLETTTINGFTDDYAYNQSGQFKIGTRRDWGGTIVFFGIDEGAPGTNGTNTIDGADTGREVQVALYDVDRWYQNCAWNNSCGTSPSPTQCPQEMTYLGWNPVQGGNRCNNGSGVEDVVMRDGAITTITQPLFWNPHWDRQDCNSDACNNAAVNTRKSDVRVTQRVRFVREHIVELSYVVKNLGDLNHRSSAHEFPTVYTAFGKDGTPDLHRLFDSNQNLVAIDQTPTGATAFRYKNFTSPGGWVSFQDNTSGYGLGFMYENGLTEFQAWQADDPKFNNFRGLFYFGLPPRGEVRARSYMILGALADVGAEIQWVDQHAGAFGSLDAPVDDATLSGSVEVYGWAMDNHTVTSVQIIVDNGAPRALTYGSSRPDVCAVWPGYPACAHNNVGFTGTLNTTALAATDCGHLIEIRATDNHGNARIIARKRFYVAN